jgi:hypothetical protein
MSNWTILGFFKARWNLGETLGLSSICKCISSLKNCLKLSLDYGYNRLGQKGFQQLSDFRFLCPDKLNEKKRYFFKKLQLLIFYFKLFATVNNKLRKANCF